MPLEATMVVIDNSEYARNGDFASTRFQAQLEALDVVFQSKIRSNPENTVGLLASGGEGPQVVSTLTADYGKILSGIHSTQIHGQLHFSTSIQVAALALKHRQNKVQHQRIVAFVGSPISESDKDLERLAKKMKKNNIAIDFINYGEESINTDKLEKFISIVNSHDNSHLLTVLPGDKQLYEAVAASPIVLTDSSSGPSASGDFGDFGDFGDAGMDPDLALALRLSLEEEQARQHREQHQQEVQAQLEALETYPEDTQQEQTQSEPTQNRNDNAGDDDTNMEDAK